MRDHQASRTAQLIARSLVLLSHDDANGHVVRPETVRLSLLFLAACGYDVVRLQRAARSRTYRRLTLALTNWMVPGIVVHYALRKAYIEEAVREAIRSHRARQVVVLGAGFDTLALRLQAELPEINFIEADHPATQAVKARALGQSSAVAAAGITLVPIDLGKDSLDLLLSSPAFKPSVNTVFVAEGVTMYLSQETIDAIMQWTRGNGGPQSRLLFTFMERDERGRVAFSSQSPALDLWLHLQGEPFQWGLSAESLARLLDAHGWSVEALATAKELRQRYLSELSAAQQASGDLVCVAAALEHA
jgi:methyltransferase (TIGR00027 family)